jgi:hypothetical protein
MDSGISVKRSNLAVAGGIMMPSAAWLLVQPTDTLRHRSLHPCFAEVRMRNEDRDTNRTDMGSMRDRDRRSDSESVSRVEDERMRNRESDDIDNMDEEDEDLQEQIEGNLGNERVRQSER